jgi:hypothetical protein
MYTAEIGDPTLKLSFLVLDLCLHGMKVFLNPDLDLCAAGVDGWSGNDGGVRLHVAVVHCPPSSPIATSRRTRSTGRTATAPTPTPSSAT